MRYDFEIKQNEDGTLTVLAPDFPEAQAIADPHAAQLTARKVIEEEIAGRMAADQPIPRPDKKPRPGCRRTAVSVLTEVQLEKYWRRYYG